MSERNSLQVQLDHEPNPDIRGGYWTQMPRPSSMKVNVDSLEEAASACRGYIERYALGGGNWSGGQVFDSEGNQIAYVSYNGGLWDLNNKKIA